MHEHRHAREITAFLNREDPAIRCANGPFHVNSWCVSGPACANRLAPGDDKKTAPRTYQIGPVQTKCFSCPWVGQQGKVINEFSGEGECPYSPSPA